MGQTSVETYYCPLSNRTYCPVQIRVTRALTTVLVETSGGEHTQARCHAHDHSKNLNFKQRLTVAKVYENQSKSDADRYPQGAPTTTTSIIDHLSRQGYCFVGKTFFAPGWGVLLDRVVHILFSLLFATCFACNQWVLVLIQSPLSVGEQVSQ